MNRRKTLQTLLASAFFLPLSLVNSPSLLAAERTRQDIEKMRSNWRKLAPADFSLPAPDDSLELDENQWRQRLTRAQFRIMREAGTERPFTSPLNDETGDGLFVCAGCDLALFSSAMKYKSGTGWPSFFTTIPDTLETQLDLSLLLPRTEYHCRRCGSHQGHLFEDGPAPTGERWCNNGVALKFIAAT